MTQLQNDFFSLSQRQRQVVEAIVQLSRQYGYPPTIQQLCEAVGLRSTSSMHYHLTALKKKAIIDWDLAKKRSVSVNATLIPLLDGGPDASPSIRESYADVSTHRQAQPIPLLGTIAAGSPLQTTDDAQEMLDLTASAYCPPGCYALRVKGFSMIEDHIMDGDIVIVNPKASVRDGDVVVALVEDEMATLKRIYRENNGVRLQPANADMEPIFTTDVRVQGKVETIIRKVF